MSLIPFAPFFNADVFAFLFGPLLDAPRRGIGVSSGISGDNGGPYASPADRVSEEEKIPELAQLTPRCFDFDSGGLRTAIVGKFLL